MAKAAIVTASDSGIGKACALQLAKAGFDIGITWHSDEQGARDTAREVESHGVRAETLQLDLSQLPQGAQALEHLIARFGRIDVLVNNAGTMSKSAFLETSVSLLTAGGPPDGEAGTGGAHYQYYLGARTYPVT